MIEIVLLLVLLISIVTDIYSRKILNVVTIPAILVGLIYYTVHSGLNGLWFSFSGFILGLVLLLIPFLFGGMGAGDVKLMAAIGALMGTVFVFHTFLFTALIGGVISIFILLRRMNIKQVIAHMYMTFIVFRGKTKEVHVSTEQKYKFSFPYGIAIVLGAFIAYIWGVIS
ncbi:A24 family peptidase [Ureibacillus acetophenoni]|uniref:Prepilin peptidase CpaA n=1 Tax=Ureibacillus acetophenoni TaxID=614649 RepID=A0A285U778_9BACL|nr:prepilin peptidase [Ureibacillus acetophenoni]SOC37258.1 prepilin peptidase CpaA [Ureibacillus acetophenoni]